MLFIVLAACQAPPDRLDVWRFAIEETRGSVQDTYAQRFAERVEERTDGAIDVKVYPYGTLGTSAHTTEQLYTGSIQFAMASPGHMGKLIPETQVFLLHWVFSDDPAVNSQAVSDPAVHSLFDELYSQKNFKLLTVLSEGWQAWTTQEQVRTPADFAGVKIRVMTSPLLLAAYDAYGASPTPLPYAEVYSALQLKMVDAQVNPVFAIEEMSFFEVTDWMIFPRHLPFVTTAVANREFYEGLSPERRGVIDEVIAELQPWSVQMAESYNAERLDRIRQARPDMHIIELTNEERQAFAALSTPVRKVFTAQAPRGQEALDALLAAVERVSAERDVPQEQSDVGDGDEEQPGAEKHDDEGR